MALSYPLSLPSTAMARIALRGNSVVGLNTSPFTLSEQVYAHQGGRLEADIDLPPLKDRAEAEAWVGFLLALNGFEGSFLMGDPLNTAPRGSWAGSPKVLGAHAAGVRSVAMDGFTAAATAKVGDWIQHGTGSSTHLHKVVQDATADGSGLATLEIWPRTRAPLADNDTFVTSSAKGLWRLASNSREWNIERAQIYGIQFSAVEKL